MTAIPCASWWRTRVRDSRRAIRRGSSTSSSAAARKGAVVGVGLGLAICRRSCARMAARSRPAAATAGSAGRASNSRCPRRSQPRDRGDASGSGDRGRARHPQRAAGAARGGALSRHRSRHRAARRDRSPQPQARSVAHRPGTPRRRRPDGDPQSARLVARARSWFCRRVPWRSRRSPRSMPARTTTSPSLSAPRSCSPASARRCAATRAAPRQTSGLKLGEVRLDLGKREAHGLAGELHLTPLEYRVLECLARHLGSIVMQGQLIREVWGPERVG